MFSAEILRLQIERWCRIVIEAKPTESKNFHPWDGDDLILNRVLQHYDEEGYQDAPDFVLNAAFKKK